MISVILVSTFRKSAPSASQHLPQVSTFRKSAPSRNVGGRLTDVNSVFKLPKVIHLTIGSP
jgi:hypothetical protein